MFTKLVFTKFFAKQLQQRRLTARLNMLKAKKSSLQSQLTQTKQANKGNAQRSDRQFKENSGKALSARAKRANKSALLDIERQIKFTEVKLTQLIGSKEKDK